jgi:hypothetical protein
MMLIEYVASPKPFALLFWTFLLTSKKGSTEDADVAWKVWALRALKAGCCLLVGLPLMMVALGKSPHDGVRLYEVLPGVKATLPDLVLALPSILFAWTIDERTRHWFPMKDSKRRS